MFRKPNFVLIAGLLCSILLPEAAMAGLVVNGGFETGDFSSWTAATHVSIYDQSSGVKSGSYSAIWQDEAPGTLSQALPTVTGQSYIVDFWASPGAGYSGDNSFFQVKFGDNVLMNMTDLSDQANWGINYQHFMYTVTGTGNDTLEFSFYSAESEGWLDDVSVSAVPVPGALWLLGSGLAGLVALRRKRKA